MIQLLLSIDVVFFPILLCLQPQFSLFGFPLLEIVPGALDAFAPSY
jgi:hypothetical protein